MLGVRRLSYTSFHLIKKNKLPPRPKFMPSLESQCEEKFLHGGRGPGGQKINKCNSKVQLKHLPTGIVVECQQTRSRDQNRKIAREKMALEIERSNNGGNTTREQALQQWYQQSKRSKERKAKDKHEQHRQERKSQQIEKLKEEHEIIRNIMGR